MLLVQQPQHPSSPSLMSPFKQLSSQSRRRGPPAPPVSSVRPTKTPGILPISVISFAKPPVARPPPSPNTTRHSSPKLPRAKASHSQPSQGERHRGRSAPAKDKPARNPSKPRAGHGGRQRQASPIPPSEVQPEQVTAEKPVLAPAPAKPIPEVVSDGSVTGKLSAPSGRLARRRKRTSLPPFASAPDTFATGATPKEPKDSKAKKGSNPILISKFEHNRDTIPKSQSVPLLPLPHTGAYRNVVNNFPICDDYEDLDLERPLSPSPSGPKSQTLTWQMKALFDSDESEPDNERGPLTAPLSSDAGFAKTFFPSLAPHHGFSPMRANHKRTPSAPIDVFNFELSASELNNGSGASESASRPRFDDSLRAASTPIRKPDATFKYASSMFQCSPSPESLPKPKFSLASGKKDVAA